MRFPDGCQWAVYESYDWTPYLDRIVSVWAVSVPRGIMECLGTGFGVGALKTEHKAGSTRRHYWAIVTAEHVVRRALMALRPESDRSQLSPFAVPDVQRLGKLAVRQELRVAIHGNPAKGEGPPAFLSVDMISVNARADMCVLYAVVPWDDVTPPVFAVNSDRLEAGRTVMMVGYPRAHDPLVKPNDVLDGSGAPTLSRSVNLKPQARLGKITHAMAGMRHKPVFAYETEIPVPPGLSGGPVFVFDEKDHSQLEVIGMCSSDASDEAKLDDTTTAGSSFVISMENLYALWGAAWPLSVAIDPPRTVLPRYERFFFDHGTRADELRTLVEGHDDQWVTVGRFRPSRRDRGV